MEKKTEEQIFKELSAPFFQKGKPSLKWVPNGMYAKPKSDKDTWKMGYTPYITKDQVSHRLNKVMGVFGWQDSILPQEKQATCVLKLKYGDQWISKSDVGTASPPRRGPAVEAEKGMVSDSLKRAAVHFGVGAYIKTVKTVWIPCKETKNKQGGENKSPWDFKTNKQLYPEQVNNYCNGIGEMRGLLTQIWRLKPEINKDKNFEELWKKYQNQ